MEGINTALSSMATTIATNAQTTMTSILPTLGTLVSIGVVVSFGVKWIRRLAK